MFEVGVSVPRRLLRVSYRRVLGHSALVVVVQHVVLGERVKVLLQAVVTVVEPISGGGGGGH